MKAIRLTRSSIPFFFLFLSILAYGLLLPVTGFYWDDWPFAWIARFLGPTEFIAAFRGFRPFLGPIFLLTTSLIPPDPQLWQAIALLIRFGSAIAVWFAFDQVWPSHRGHTFTVALLFLLFPGYSQQWVAYTHINQEWISLIAYLLSFGLSVHAIRHPHQFIRYTIGAIVLQVIGLLPTEYFIGLEPIRLMLLWVAASESNGGFRARLLAALKKWWPYFLIWLANVAWLLQYYGSGAYISYDLIAARTIPTLNEISQASVDALWKAGVYVWIQVIPLLAGSITAPTSLLTIILILITFVLAAFYLRHLNLLAGSPPQVVSTNAPEQGYQVNQSNKRFAKEAILIGSIGVLLGRIPSFAAGLPLTLQSSFDRFMISMMLGASLLVVGLITLLFRDMFTRILILASLVALAVGQQFFNANIFRRDWQRQQEIYWQFAWRIPGLQPHTAIITQQMPLDYETDLSMTAALNWIYSPQFRPSDLAYALIYSEKRLGGSVLPSLKPNNPMELPFRTLEFTGNTSQVVVVYVPQNGCLRVLDPALDDETTYSRFPESLTAPIHLSNTDRIITNSPSPILPDPPFGREPFHGWCYYYEKAELARQVGDWKGILELDTATTQQGLKPNDAFEWLPFIEAKIRVGKLVDAEQVSRQLWQDEPKLHRGLCVLWKRTTSGGPEPSQDLGIRLFSEFNCGG